MDLRTNADKLAWAEQQYPRSQDDLAKLLEASQLRDQIRAALTR